MLGVVACETYYPEFWAADAPVCVEYVPQWLHEFPIHPPDSAAIHREIQDRIDRLESKEVDAVLILYHDLDGIQGLTTTNVPLLVSRGGDCIDFLLPDQSRDRYGEAKSTHTYYLTRGWIDVGLDFYKVYMAYAGKLDSLISRFKTAQRAHPDMRVSWPNSGRIKQAEKRSEGMRTDPGAFLGQVVGGYHQVLLIDTGQLHPFHHEYAETFRSFINSFEEGEASDVTLRVIDGTTERFRKLIDRPTSDPDVWKFDPGEAVAIEDPLIAEALSEKTT